MDQSNPQPGTEAEPTPVTRDAPGAPAEPLPPAEALAPAEPLPPAEALAPAELLPPAEPPASPWVRPAPAPAAAPPPATGWSQATPTAATLGGVTPVARFAGLLIALIGMLWLVVGGIAVAGGSLIRDYIDSSQFRASGFQGNAGDLVGGTVAGIGIVLVAVALIEIVAGLGALAGRDWGRVLGILYSIVFGLAMLVILAASVQSQVDVTGRNGSGPALGFIIAHVVAYGFALVALAVRWRRRIA